MAIALVVVIVLEVVIELIVVAIVIVKGNRSKISCDINISYRSACRSTAVVEVILVQWAK